MTITIHHTESGHTVLAGRVVWLTFRQWDARRLFVEDAGGAPWVVVPWTDRIRKEPPVDAGRLAPGESWRRRPFRLLVPAYFAPGDDYGVDDGSAPQGAAPNPPAPPVQTIAEPAIPGLVEAAPLEERQQLIRMAIDELGAECRRGTWRKRLDMISRATGLDVTREEVAEAMKG